MEQSLQRVRDARAKRAIHARARQRLAALAPQARSVHCVTVLSDDGAVALDSVESADLLAWHWRQVFEASLPPGDGAMQRFLRFARPLDGAIAHEPRTFPDFATTAQHTSHSAPGPHGVPHDTWLQCGEGGLLVLYQACLATLDGDAAPDWLNASLVVFLGAPGMPMPRRRATSAPERYPTHAGNASPRRRPSHSR